MRFSKCRESGFSMTEVLVMSTVMAVMLLGATQMFVNQAKQQQNARAKVDFLQIQAQIQNAAASPLAVKTSAEQVGVSFRGFHFGLLNLPTLLKDPAADPTTLLRDPSIFVKAPLFDPDLIYTNLVSVTPNVVDPFRPTALARLPGGGVTDPSPLADPNLRSGLEAVQGQINVTR